MADVIFVSGTGRCGTSIVAEMLASSPKVVKLPFELRFLTDPDGLIDYLRSVRMEGSPFELDLKLKRLESFLLSLAHSSWWDRFVKRVVQILDPSGRFLARPPYADWNLSKWIYCYEAFVNELIQKLKSASFSGSWIGYKGRKTSPEIWLTRVYNITKYYLSAFFKQVVVGILFPENFTSADYFVSDDTWSLLYADDLLEIVPEAKFIWARRDPRDVVSSFMSQSWCPKNAIKAARYYVQLHDGISRSFRRIPDNKKLEVQFEDLFEGDYCTERLISFVGIRGVLSKLSEKKAHIGRWKKDLPYLQCREAHRILHPYLE